ncbi:MAG TPA: GntR family transcriptional regulator [Thermohalobaculum sp.]|nr:GntR family transcriptional regulator [Thermohalobaculum sp.]
MSVEFLDPVEHRSLPQSVAEQLRELIVTLVLPPGAKLDEKALCERLGVSRTPFREAMRVLEAEGLVVITPRRGFRVSIVTLRDLEEAFPILGALEALAAELAALRLNTHGLQVLRFFQDAMAEAHAKGDLDTYFRLNEQIHRTIREASENETLLAMLDSFSTRIRRARYMANTRPERWAAAVEEHEELLQALGARDAPRVGRLMRRHLANKHKAIVAGLRSSGGLSQEGE